MVVTRALVSVIDDDESVRESLPDLLRQLGYDAKAFASAGAFLKSSCIDHTNCLVLDIAMPGMSGPELQQELSRLGWNIPIVFITAHDDERLRRELFARGAIDYLRKPFSDTSLLEALKKALR